MRARKTWRTRTRQPRPPQQKKKAAAFTACRIFFRFFSAHLCSSLTTVPGTDARLSASIRQEETRQRSTQADRRSRVTLKSDPFDVVEPTAPGTSRGGRQCRVPPVSTASVATVRGFRREQTSHPVYSGLERSCQWKDLSIVD
jgi:hypothetical protein